MVFEQISVIEFWILIVLGFLFLLSGIITAGIIFWRMRWSYVVDVYENSALGFIPTRRDRARLVPFGDGGEQIYYLRKHKKHKIAYGKKIGLKRIAWAISDSDGYWYNVTFGNLDKKLLELGMIPTERSMRYAQASARKGFENRYNDKTFFEKWAVPMTLGMLILAIIIQGGGTWWNIREANKAKATELETSQTNLKVIEANKQVLSQLNIIQRGGAGIVAAATPTPTPAPTGT